ncbi:MAG: hypothetical protein IJY99_02480 [Alphaproteobacteria bacterium]|nr:hypothetical protein [Alphaproteobacteria bacterium]
MKQILSNVKTGVLLPIALMMITACMDTKEEIAELTAQQISLDKSISRLKYMRDSTARAQINQDDIAYMGSSNRNTLDSLQRENFKLSNKAHADYVNRVYKNHKLKHYFKPNEIKQIRAWFADMGASAPVKNVTGDMPMFYLTYLYDLETDTTKTFSTPFLPDFSRGNVVYLDKRVAALLAGLERQVSNHDIYVAEANLEEETKKRYDTERKKFVDMRHSVEYGIDNGMYESSAKYTKACATIEQCERELQRIFNKYYFNDVTKGRFVAKSVMALRDQNKGEKIYCLEHLNFAIPEYAAVRKQLLKNDERIRKLANANERADAIERKVVAQYDARIKPLTQRRDSINRLIRTLNNKTY